MKKTDLRYIYKEKREKINTLILSKKITQNILKLDIFLTKKTYHVFITIENKKEIFTDDIIHILKNKNKEIIIPRINNQNNTLENILLEDNTIFKLSKNGIKEPQNGKIIDDKTIDIVIIPLLAFDKLGYRVGYGKGFYDKFLSNCRKNVIKIGLSFFEAEEKIDDSNKFDIKLNYCITPKNIYKF